MPLRVSIGGDPLVLPHHPEIAVLSVQAANPSLNIVVIVGEVD
jgi:hypothetical protein